MFIKENIDKSENTININFVLLNQDFLFDAFLSLSTFILKDSEHKKHKVKITKILDKLRNFIYQFEFNK